MTSAVEHPPEFPIPVSVVTDKWSARIFMGTTLIAALLISAVAMRKLFQLEPPKVPAYSSLFLDEGRHLWTMTDVDTGECIGVVAGGWKELKNSELIKFTALTPHGTKATVRAEFSEYKLLNRLDATVEQGSRVRKVSYDGETWTGAPKPTEEPILFVETRFGTRMLKLPNRLIRALDYTVRSEKIRFNEAAPGEFFSCKHQLEPKQRDILEGLL